MADVVQLMDALGKVLETQTPNIESALKQLAGAMTAAVTKIDNAMNGGKTDAFFDLITDKGDKIKKFSTYLQTDMPKAFEKLAGDIKDVSKELQETATTLENIRKNSKGGGGAGGGGGGGSSGDCACERFLTAINDSVQAVHNTMTGPGIKLESDVMRVLKSINHNIRKLGSLSVPTRSDGGGRRGGGGGRDTSRAVPKDGDPRDDVLDGAEDVLKEGGKSKRRRRGPPISASNVERALRNLKGRIPINKNEIDVLRKMARELRDAQEAYNKLKRDGQDTAEAEERLNKARKEASKALKDIQKKYNTIYQIAKEVAKNTAFNLFSDAFKGFMLPIFSNTLQDLTEWEKESTRMAATMTSGIDKAGGATSKLVGEYRQLLEVSDTVIEQTHQFPKIVRKEWLKAIQKGTRGLKETRDVISSGLAAAWQVGSSAEATSDEFQKWNMRLGMSSEGANSLARTMSTTAKLTGVMGDNLLQAVSAAREIAELMRNTGLYSQETANSVVHWMTSAQKFNVDKQVQNIFNAAQGGLEAFNNASSETRNLLAASGQLQGIMSGNADPDNVAEGVRKAILDVIPAKAFPNGSRLAGLPDLKKLDKSEISKIDLIMKKRVGMKLGESLRVAEALQDPSKILEKIQKDIANPRLTEEEKKKLKLEEEQLKIAIREKGLIKGLDKIGNFSNSLKDLSDDPAQRASEAAKLLSQNKDLGKIFAESTQKLDEKLQAQGKSFNVMGKTSKQFSDKMNELLPEVGKGNDDAILEFRKMQIALSEANKTADSSAKNNSNNADRMESDQQRLQNLFQNLAKPIHTVAFQAPIWTWYLISIAGGIWTLARMWGNGRIAENMQRTADTLLNTLGRKGSGYVHDIHTEQVLLRIERLLSGRTGNSGGGDGGFGGGGWGGSNKEKMTVKGKYPKGPKAELPTPQMSGSNALMEGSGKLLAIAAGVVALGTVLILAAETIMSMTGFDAKKAQEVAWVIGVVIGAGAGALIAAAGAAKLMESASKTITPASIPKIYWGGLMLVAILPAIALIAGAIIGIGYLAEKMGIDLEWAKGVAINIGAILLAAGVISLAVLGAAAALTALGFMATFAWMVIPLMALGALALIALTPAMIVIAAAIIWLAQKTLEYFKVSKESEAAVTGVTNILVAAGKIAGAVLLGSVALTALGAMSLMTWILVPAMEAGTSSLIALTPVVVGMASAIITMAKGLNLGPVGKDGETASKNLANVLESASKISAAVVSSEVSLTALGALSMILWTVIPAMHAGAETLRAMTPDTLALARSIINMAKDQTMGNMDKDAEKAAKNLASVLESAGKIAKSVVDNKNYLNELSRMSGWSDMINSMMGGSKDTITNIASSILDGVIKPIMLNFPQVSQVDAAIDNVIAVTDRMKDLVQAMHELSDTMEEMRGSGVNLGTLANIGSLSGIMSLVSSMGSMSAKTTTNNTEYDKRVQSRVEQSRPSESMTSSMEYLSQIAANTAATNDAIKDAIDVLETISGKLDSGGEETAGTSSAKKPKGITPKYNKWSLGTLNQSSLRQSV